jgi:hypothetical protein
MAKQPKWSKLVKRNASIEDVMRLITRTAKEGAGSRAVLRILEHVPYRNFPNDMMFLKAVFGFFASSLQYKLDESGKEQIKTPDRFLLKDGFGDCDDFAVLWGALLNHLGKKFSYKIVSYDPNGTWAHIYVIVPLQGGNVVILDNVLGRFNEEVGHVKSKLY